MMKQCQKINLQEPQRCRNATANFVNSIMNSIVSLPPSLTAKSNYQKAGGNGRKSIQTNTHFNTIFNVAFRLSYCISSKRNQCVRKGTRLRKRQFPRAEKHLASTLFPSFKLSVKVLFSRCDALVFKAIEISSFRRENKGVII